MVTENQTSFLMAPPIPQMEFVFLAIQVLKETSNGTISNGVKSTSGGQCEWYWYSGKQWNIIFLRWHNWHLLKWYIYIYITMEYNIFKMAQLALAEVIYIYIYIYIFSYAYNGSYNQSTKSSKYKENQVTLCSSWFMRSMDKERSDVYSVKLGT